MCDTLRATYQRPPKRGPTLLSHRTIDVRRFGIGLGLAAGAIAAAALAGSPLAYADVYDLEPVGPATVLNDDGIAGLFAYGQVTQEFAEIGSNGTTSVVATGPEAGSLDVTEDLFASPYFGNYGFIDGADATGSGTYAADAGNASDWALQIGTTGTGTFRYLTSISPPFSATFPAPQQQRPCPLTISASAAWERT